MHEIDGSDKLSSEKIFGLKGESMNTLVQQGFLSEMICENNLSYILSENTILQSTEYKVLCHQKNGVFAECFEMKWNGKIQLYYLTNKYIPLEKLISQMQWEKLVPVFIDLYSSITQIKKNGFLCRKSIIADPSAIYVDINLSKVKWIYLPVIPRVYSDELQMERMLNQQLFELLQENNKAGFEPLMNILADEAASSEQILAFLKNNTAIRNHISQMKQNSNRLIVKIKSLDALNPLELIDDRDEYLIGRKASAVNGVVPFNKLIGRVHCMIKKDEHGYSLVDLQSVNGTFLNEERLKENTPYPLSNGDVLRLANSKFIVSVEEK